MKCIRYALIPAVAALMFGVGGAAHADSYKLYFGSPGVAFGFKSGHGHYGHGSHYYPRRHVYKRHYRAYPRYGHGHYKRGYRHGYYKHGYRHPGRHYYGHKKYRHRGHGYGYRGHRRYGWSH